MAGRVVHFEIHVDDPQRAMDFYAALFGWKYTKFPGPQDYWLVTTGPDSEPGINGGIIPRKGANAGDAIMSYICTVKTDDIELAIGKVRERGCDLCHNKMAIPCVGWLAYFKDTEGNIVGIMQDDPNAK